jgi:hypothetical protein
VELGDASKKVELRGKPKQQDIDGWRKHHQHDVFDK